MLEQKTKLDEAQEKKHESHLMKVLGPMHIWALGVGIVLVGEFMGWNFTIAKGGSLGSIIACWIIGILYISLVMNNTEIGSVIPEAGGQYAMGKYLLGPLAAFNIGLMLVFEYVMLEAADALVVGQILQSLHPDVQALPYIILSLLLLTYLNYRGVYATLTLNFFITAIAFGFTGLLDQVITFSILSALLVYVLTAYMMFKFRAMYPLGTIERGYTAPWHPIPAIVLLLLTLTTLVGMYFGYWINMISGLMFYLLASVWFTMHRSKFVDKETFIKAGAGTWPRPRGY